MGVIQNKQFIFNGLSSSSFGLICSGNGTYGAPKRSLSEVYIPGRNGALLQDNGYYEDSTVTYPGCWLIDNTYYDYHQTGTLEKRIEAVRGWLLSPSTYQRLEDTWHPDIYRLGYISDDFNPTMLQALDGGSVDISFKCKPQRFLKSGERYVQYSTGARLLNPTKFDAVPCIRFYFAAQSTSTDFSVNGEMWFRIESKTYPLTTFTEINMEDLDAHHGTENRNLSVTYYKDTSELVLKPGYNTITFDSSVVSKCIIQPNYWTL
jgi:phage-related protein